jgi:hypothetical protein
MLHESQILWHFPVPHLIDFYRRLKVPVFQQGVPAEKIEQCVGDCKQTHAHEHGGREL